MHLLLSFAKDYTDYNFKRDTQKRDLSILFFFLGIHIQDWPVYGMFQPDSIHVVQSHGVEYIITANEGDVKDYSDLPLQTTGFSESVRVKDLTLSGTGC